MKETWKVVFFFNYFWATPCNISFILPEIIARVLLTTPSPHTIKTRFLTNFANVVNSCSDGLKSAFAVILNVMRFWIWGSTPCVVLPNHSWIRCGSRQSVWTDASRKDYLKVINCRNIYSKFWIKMFSWVVSWSTGNFSTIWRIKRRPNLVFTWPYCHTVSSIAKYYA